MITNHEYADAPLFNIDQTDKQLLITIEGKPDVIDNTLLNDDGMELIEALCEEDQLHFGSCVASQIRLTMDVNAVAYSLEGMTIYVKMYLNGHTGTVLDIGTYKVESDQKDSNTDNRIITAYDALKQMNEADVSSWYDTLLPNDDSTTTLKTMRDSFFLHFSVTQDTVNLPNDAMPIKKTYVKPLNGATVIKDICEANGVFGHINRKGKFVYLNIVQNTTPLYPSDDLYPSDTLYPSDGFNRVMSMADSNGGYISGEFENYSVQKIDVLEILSEAGDVGQTIGSGDNIYTIQDNALFFGMSASQLTQYGGNVFDAIKNATYTPYELEALGSPCYEVGDGVVCQTYNGIIKSYILRRSLVGVQALIDTYSAHGQATYTRDFGNIRSSVQALQNRANILKRDVDQTMSEIYNEQGVSRITQNAEAIALEVTRATGAEGKLSSRITQNATSITAKVSKVSPKGQTSFSWEMTDSKMEWKTNGNRIMLLDASGLEIKGKVEATSGKIAKFTIGNYALEYNGLNAIYGKTDQGMNIFEIGDSNFDIVRINGSTMKIDASLLQIDSGQGVEIDGDLELTLGDLIVNGVAKTPVWKQSSSVQPTDYVLVGT